MSLLVTIAGKGKVPPAAKETKPRAPRQKKADRGFAPENSGLRPSEYRLARRLIWHFGKCRNDAEYGRRFDEMVLREKEKSIADARRIAEWRAAQTEPAPLRVRASELKDCSRKQALRIMSFPQKPTPARFGHWNVSAMIGTDLHLLLQTALKFLGVIKREVQVPGYVKPRYGAEFNVKTEANDFSGRVDTLIDGTYFTTANDWAEEGEEGIDEFLLETGHLDDAVVDVKTVGPDDFEEGAHGRKVQGYIAQVSAYARLLGAKKGVILLVDRGSGKMMDFAWDVDPDYADGQLKRASLIVEQAKARQLPPAEQYDPATGKFDGTCFLFCPFFDVCKAEVETGLVQQRLDEGASPEDIFEEFRWRPGR